MELKDLEPIKGKLRKDLSGKKFGRLTVIKPVGSRNGDIFYICNCICGNTKIINGKSLRHGDTKSCGCIYKESNFGKTFTHGKSTSGEYNAWQLMKGRCLNDNNKNKDYYKGRHIRVSYEWMNSFESFYNDLGDKPTKDHTLDRINTNFNYTKWNCRWATRKEQSRNLRSNTLITYNNKTQCLAAWADELGIVPSTLSARLGKLNWTIEKAFTKKVRKRKED